MAELAEPTPPLPRLADQLRAIASVRWQLVRNSLRTVRGRFEAASRVVTTFWFCVLGLGGTVGFAVGGWAFVHRGTPQWIAVLLWPLFLFWQIFPLASSAFMEHADTSYLARFPLSYTAYFWVRLAYGALDVATGVGLACLVGLTVGVAIAAPAMLPAMIAAAALFALFNIGLAQMIFAWLERWLARRRTREIVALLFFLGIFAVNFIGPAIRHWHGHAPGAWRTALPIASWLPPAGLAMQMVAAPWLRALTAAALLVGATVIVLALLNLRLRAEYRGEVSGETAAPARRKARPSPVLSMAPDRWQGVPSGGPVLAVAIKEVRYLLRSPMLFFSLIMPIALLLLFRVQGGGRGAAFGPESRWTASGLGFPIGVAYGVMILTNLVFNVFGTDGVGINFYFLAPVRFRQILQGKNLCYSLVLTAEVAVIYAATVLIDGVPSPWITAVTVLAVAFAVLMNFAAGNLVSLFLPKKIDLSRLGRQNARGATGFIAIGLMAVDGGMVAIAVLAGIVLHHLWITPAALVALAAAAAAIYGILLQRAEALAFVRREVLIAELSKA